MRNYSITMTLMVCLISLNVAFSQSEEYGIASFYDDSFQGAKTSSGEFYDKVKYTGAHKTLPFGTIVQVTRLDTKESVKIRINDRGPYIKGRIIELSKKAAQKIDLVKAGVAKVKIEVLGSGVVPDEYSASTTTSVPKTVTKSKPKTNVSKTKDDKLKTTVKTIPKKNVKPAPIAETKPAPKSVPTPAAKVIETEATAKRVRGSNFQMYDLYKVQILRPERTGFGVQVASLTNYANVMRQVAELQEKWFKNILISVEKGADNQPIYKIMLGPFPDRDTAKSYEKDLKKKKKIDGFIVDLTSIKY